MSDEELLKLADELMNQAFNRSRFTLFMTPLWAAAREQFPEHPYMANREGIRDALRDAHEGNLLALAVLRELHTQYALAILTS